MSIDREKEISRLFLQYYRELCAFTYRYVRSEDAAEDIVQETFSRIWSSHTVLADEQDGASVRSYLYRCVRNRAIDYLRNSENCRDRLDDYLNNAALEHHVEHLLIDREGEAYDYRVLLHEVQAVVAAFPPKTRQVFVMSRMHKMSNKEIAAALGVSVKAIEKHITKALLRIREHLKAELGMLEK